MAVFEIVAGAAALKLLSDSSSSNSGADSSGTPPPRAAPQQRNAGDLVVDKLAAAGITAGSAAALAAGKVALGAIGTAASANGVTAGGAFGVAAYAAEQAALGYAITGDGYGSASALAFPAPAVGADGFIVSAGNVGNVGRVVGEWMDKFLGGDGKTGRGLALQVIGYIGGLIVGLWGLYALPIVGELALLGAAIATAVDDLVQVSYGQQGLLRDMRKQARDFFLDALHRGRDAILSAQQLTELQPVDEQRLAACTAVITIGYMRENVNQKYRQWTVHAPGGPNNPNDGGWAAARGKLLLSAGQQALFSYVTALGGAPPAVVADPDAFQGAYPLYIQEAQTRIALISTDSHFLLDQRGVGLANFGHYLTAMAQMWGIGAGATGNAVYWRDKEKFFFGDIATLNGNLFAPIGGGQAMVDWQASAGAGKPVFMLESQSDPAIWSALKASMGPLV